MVPVEGWVVGMGEGSAARERQEEAERRRRPESHAGRFMGRSG
jgi:hypothetical protein